MKALVGMLVAVTLISGSAVAAPAKKKTAKRSAKAKVQKLAANSKLAAAEVTGEKTPAVQEPTSVVAPAPSTGAAVTSSSISEVAAPPAKRWSFLIDSWNEAPARAVNASQADVTAINALRAGYKLTPDVGLSLTGLFSNSWGYQQNGKTAFTVEDPYLMITHSNIATLPGDLKVQGYVRFYPGISEASRNKETVGIIRPSLTIGKGLGPITLSYTAIPRFYLQRTNTFFDGKSAANGGLGDEKPNNNFRVQHFLTFEATFSKKWSLYSNLGMDWWTYHSDPNSPNASVHNVADTNHVYAETGLAYAFNDNFTLIGGMYQDKSTGAKDLYKSEEQIYSDLNSAYFLDGVLTF